jgi:hypothetical protein
MVDGGYLRSGIIMRPAAMGTSSSRIVANAAKPTAVQPKIKISVAATNMLSGLAFTPDATGGAVDLDGSLRDAFGDGVSDSR